MAAGASARASTGEWAADMTTSALFWWRTMEKMTVQNLQRWILWAFGRTMGGSCGWMFARCSLGVRLALPGADNCRKRSKPSCHGAPQWSFRSALIALISRASLPRLCTIQSSTYASMGAAVPHWVIVCMMFPHCLPTDALEMSKWASLPWWFTLIDLLKPAPWRAQGRVKEHGPVVPDASILHDKTTVVSNSSSTSMGAPWIYWEDMTWHCLVGRHCQWSKQSDSQRRLT